MDYAWSGDHFGAASMRKCRWPRSKRLLNLARRLFRWRRRPVGWRTPSRVDDYCASCGALRGGPHFVWCRAQQR